MKVMFACLADHAQADQQGKLNIMGVFDRIQAGRFPARHPQMFLVFRLLLDADDNAKPHRLTIVLRDADHREAAKFEADLAMHTIEAGEFVTINQMIRLADVTFIKPGRYVFAIRADQEEEVTVPFDVAPIPPTAP